jgi:hypothetical protein
MSGPKLFPGLVEIRLAPQFKTQSRPRSDKIDSAKWSLRERMIGGSVMSRLSFREGRQEIVSLLEAGEEEFEKGNKFAALTVLLEAQGALSEIFQTEIEKIECGSLKSLFLLQCLLTSPAAIH